MPRFLWMQRETNTFISRNLSNDFIGLKLTCSIEFFFPMTLGNAVFFVTSPQPPQLKRWWATRGWKYRQKKECWNAYIFMTAHICTIANRRHIVAVSLLSEGRNSLKYDNIFNIYCIPTVKASQPALNLVWGSLLIWILTFPLPHLSSLWSLPSHCTLFFACIIWTIFSNHGLVFMLLLWDHVMARQHEGQGSYNSNCHQ